MDTNLSPLARVALYGSLFRNTVVSRLSYLNKNHIVVLQSNNQLGCMLPPHGRNGISVTSRTPSMNVGVLQDGNQNSANRLYELSRLFGQRTLKRQNLDEG
jgi:hypothetical protein